MTYFQAQLDGMLAGYNAAKDSSEDELTMAKLYFLNFGGSIVEMYEVFDFQREHALDSSSLLQRKFGSLKHHKRSAAKFEKVT